MNEKREELFMDKNYVAWLGRARKTIVEIMGEQKMADAIIQYNIFSAVLSCFKEDEEEQESLRAYIEKLLKTLFLSLNIQDMYDEKLWMSFWGNTKDYKDFLEEFNFAYNLSLDDMGNKWLEKFEQMDEFDKSKKEELLKELSSYSTWNMAFFSVYSYQYWNANPCSHYFNIHRLSVLQYWEYREIENYVDKIKDLTLEEQIERLTRLYCVSEFDKQYPDRETLFLDMIEHNLTIAESLKMIKRIRTGRKLIDWMEDRLRKVGYEENVISEMNRCRYLKSRSSAITRLLYIQNIL